MSMLDYNDIVYMHTAVSTLKALDKVYKVFRSTLCFTGEGFKTHYSTLYERREWHCLLFMCKSLQGKLPSYLNSHFKIRHSSYYTRSQSFITLETPQMKSEVGKLVFHFFAPMEPTTGSLEN